MELEAKGKCYFRTSRASRRWTVETYTPNSDPRIRDPTPYTLHPEAKFLTVTVNALQVQRDARVYVRDPDLICAGR